MSKIKFRIALISICLLFAPGVTAAKWSLTPRVSVEEQYDDNIFLTEKNERDDFTTIVSPGVNLKSKTPTGEIYLDYEFRRHFYYDFTELDYSGHHGKLEARKDFTPRFGLEVREAFTRSEDPIERGEVAENQSIRVGERKRYTRNIVEPETIFRFGERSSIRLGYRNQILRSKADDEADQDENTFNSTLSYRMNIHNGLEVFYQFRDQDYGSTTPPEPPRDFERNEVRGRYTHYFDPKTSVFTEYRYYQLDYDHKSTGFVDYEVHNPVVGFSQSLHETFSTTIAAGYLYRAVDNENNEEAFFGRLDLSGRFTRLDVGAYAETGFENDYDSAEALGFFKYWRTGFNGTYRMHERFWAGAAFFFQRANYEDIDRIDKYTYLQGTLNHQPLKWLIFSFSYEYNDRESDAIGDSYTDNRYFFGITLQYDVAERLELQ